MDARAAANGDIFFYPSGIFDFNCEIKANQFPFDEQVCYQDEKCVVADKVTPICFATNNNHSSNIILSLIHT